MKLAVPLLTVVVLGACVGHDVQTTSGAAYLARYGKTGPEIARPAATLGQPASLSDDVLVREAASVEPTLVFPARIGLARIEAGRLTTIPGDEVGLWVDLAKERPDLGSFVRVEPLIADLAASSLRASAERMRWPSSADLLTKLRLGAARQHVDAVLVYEVGVRSSKAATGIGFADLTIIGGALLPTRSIEVEGRGTALLFDVRNGYPYGTAQASTDLSELGPSWGSDRRVETMRRQAALATVRDLVPEVRAMVGEVAREAASRAVAVEPMRDTTTDGVARRRGVRRAASVAAPRT